MITQWTKGNSVVYFLLTAGLALILIWSVPHFPSQDGPWQLENATLLNAHWHGDSGPDLAVYEFKGTNFTNGLTHFALAGLLNFVPPPTAEKIWVTIYVFSFLAVYFFFFSSGGNTSPWLLLAFPLAFNFYLHLGSYNFCFSLVLFLVTLGFWYPRRDRPTFARVAVLTGLLLCQFVMHPLAILFFLTILGVFCVTGGRIKNLSWALAAIPSVGLVLYFVQSHGADTVWQLPPLGESLLHLVLIDSLYSFQNWEKIIAGVIFLLFLVTGVRHFKKSEALLPGCALVFILVFLITPERAAAGGLLPDRVLLFPFLVTLAWLGWRTGGGNPRRWEKAACLTIVLVQFFSHEFNYLRINETLEDLIDHTPPLAAGKILLPVNYTYWGPMESPVSYRIAPFIHLGGVFAYRHRVIDLDNSMAESHLFPVNFREGFVPSRHLGGGTHGYPPVVDIARFEKETGEKVDYVIVWGVPKFLETHPAVTLLRTQLNQNYHLISQPGALPLLLARSEKGPDLAQLRNAKVTRPPGR